MILQQITRLSCVALAGAVAALAVPAPVAAVPMVFFGIDNINTHVNPHPIADAARKQFVNALGAASISTQDFQGVGLGNLFTPTTNVFAKGVGSTFSNTATTFVRIKDGIGDFDTHDTSPGHFLEAQSGPNSTYFTVTFAEAVRGIGFYVTDVSDWAGTAGNIIVETLKVVLTTASGSFERELTPGLDPHTLVNANTAFFGIVDDAEPFLSIAIRGASTPDEDGLGFDDVMISIRAVPAPGTLPLLLGLLPLLGFLRRRAA